MFHLGHNESSIQKFAIQTKLSQTWRTVTSRIQNSQGHRDVVVFALVGDGHHLVVLWAFDMSTVGSRSKLSMWRRRGKTRWPQRNSICHMEKRGGSKWASWFGAHVGQLLALVAGTTALWGCKATYIFKYHKGNHLVWGPRNQGNAVNCQLASC